MSRALAANGFLVRQRLKNVLASLSLAILAILFYAYVPYFQDNAGTRYEVFSSTWHMQTIYLYVGLTYVSFLILFYLSNRQPGVSKSVYCWRALGKLTREPRKTWNEGLESREKLGLLSSMVKMFFGPMMVVFLIDHIALLLISGTGLFTMVSTSEQSALTMFNVHGFWFMFQLIMLVDVTFFTIGYLIELPSLKSEIRSVEPTLLGWLVALACYPPLNDVTSSMLGWHSSNFPKFESPSVHVAMNLALLVLMGIYAAASAALNFKASNLTHRGIVSTGPYRYVRHPAYISKNLAWWIGGMPTLTVAAQSSLFQAGEVLISLLGWTVIYYLRAVTEEDHLRRVDDEYNRYCEKVRYRFVPGLY